MGLQMCYGYPCGDDAVDVWAWDQQMAVVADVYNSSLVDGSSSFDFQLTGGDATLWVDFGDQWAALVPSDVGVSSTEEYQLTVSVELVDGRLAVAVVEGLVFAATTW